MDPSTLLDEAELVDEPEDQTSEEDTDTEETDEAEEVRKNAARKITSFGADLRKTDLALVDLIAETPEKAPDIIKRIQGENPKLAARLSKLYTRRDINQLAEKFKDPAIAEAFEALSTQVDTLNQRTEQQQIAQDKRVMKQWKEGTTELEDASLLAAFKTALDQTFQNQPITEDILEDALAIAKRRIGWIDEPTKKAAAKVATQQALKARSGSSPSGGKGIRADAPIQADPVIADKFGSTDPERMKKIAEAKKKAGF